MSNTANNRLTTADSQELLQSLSKIPETSGHFRKTIGSEFLTEYLAIMKSKPLVELDWFCHTGQLTPNETFQYAQLSGEMDNIKKQLSDLAEKMANSLGPKMIGLISFDRAGKRKDGLANLFHTIDHLHIFIPAELKEKVSFHSHFLKIFTDLLFSLLGMKLIEIANQTTDPRLKHDIESFLHHAEVVTRIRNGHSFLGLQLYNEIKITTETLSTKQNLSVLDQLIDYRNLSDEERELLDLENKIYLEDIKKSASSRKIIGHEVRNRSPQINFLADELTENIKYEGFCTVRINFGPCYDVPPPIKKIDPSGNGQIEWQMFFGLITFTINPLTGNLCFLGNNCLNLSRSLDPDRYLLLKSYLFKQLKKYLDAKEPDLEDLFLYSPTEKLAHISEETRLELTPATQTEEKFDPTWTYSPYVKENANSNGDPQLIKNDNNNSEIADDEMDHIPKSQRKLILDKIWGAKGSEAIAALRRMMKSPKQEGSHLFFQSQRTGRSLPVPNHQYLPPPIIIDHLEKWGYSLREYAEELGLKL